MPLSPAMAQALQSKFNVPTPVPTETTQALARSNQPQLMNMAAPTGADPQVTAAQQGLGNLQQIKSIFSSIPNYRQPVQQQSGPVGANNTGAPAAGANPTSVTNGVPKFAGSNLGERAVNYAEQFMGTPYRWGGSQPGGFDCSGLVQYVYGKLGVNLPRIASAQAATGTTVPITQLRPGDLVAIENNGRQPGADHIGIYVGNGRYLNAPRTGANVRIDTVPANAWGVKLGF